MIYNPQEDGGGPSSDTTAPTGPQGDGQWHRNPDGSVTGPDGTVYPAGSPQALSLPDQGVPGATGDVMNTPAPTPADPTTGVPPPGSNNPGNQNPPDIYGSPLTAPYPGTFTAPTPTAMPGTPTFTGANAAPTFTAPSVADALNNPGYQFQVQQGDAGQQNWAAARGTLNDSSTAKALSDYNQAAAQQDYQQVFNNSLQGWETQDQNWTSSVLNPTMLAYSTNAAATQHVNDTNYQNAWNAYLDSENQYYNWQNNTWSKLFQSATA